MESRPESNNYKTRSSLHSAVENGKLNAVKELLSQGLSVNSVDVLNRTLLHIACHKGYNDIVQILLDRHAKLESQDFNGETPIHLAAATGHLAVMKLLLKTSQFEKEPYLINARNSDGETPLHLAAVNGHDKMIKYIVDHGAIVNSLTLAHDSPLNLAAAAGKPTAVKELLKYIVDINSVEYKAILIELAIGEDYVNKIFVRHPRATMKISVAEEIKYVQIVDLLVAAGIKIQYEDGSRNPLYIAVRSERELIAERLIQHGMNINLLSNTGKTSLHYSVLFGLTDMARMLVKNGADVTRKCRYGHYPIHHMVFGQQYQCLSILINAGADINCKTRNGETIFDCMCSDYTEDDALFIYTVLKHGANIHATGSNGDSALHTLCPFYASEYAGILLDSFLDFNIENFMGDTPLESAINERNSSVETIKFIIKMITKMEFQSNFIISTNNMAIISKDYFDLYLNCKVELVNLKNRKVWGEVSFFELIDKPVDELKDYTRNCEMMKVLNSGVCWSFPEYGHLINNRMSFASNLRNIHDKSANSLQELVYPIKLPQLVTDGIMSFLNVYDMKILSSI